MIVVLFGATEHRQMVTGVVDHRVHHDKQHPDGDGHRMAGTERWSHVHRQQIADDELEGMGVHGGPGHRGRPLMVLLVDVLVPEAGVQQSVAVVEGDLPGHDTDDHVPQNDVDRGQDTYIGQSGHHQLAAQVGQVRGWQSVHHLVGEHGYDQVLQLGNLQRFVRSGLVLVFAHKFGLSGDVHEHEQSSDDPEQSVRPYCEAPDVDGIRFVT